MFCEDWICLDIIMREKQLRYKYKQNDSVLNRMLEKCKHTGRRKKEIQQSGPLTDFFFARKKERVASSRNTVLAACVLRFRWTRGLASCVLRLTWTRGL